MGPRNENLPGIGWEVALQPGPVRGSRHRKGNPARANGAPDLAIEISSRYPQGGGRIQSMEAEIENGSSAEIPGSDGDVGYGGCAPDPGVRPKRRGRVRNLSATAKKAAAHKVRLARAAARTVRESLVPVLSQSEVAEEMSRIEGRKVSRQLVELWELSAISKILDGFREERGFFVEPTEELSRLKARLETLEKKLHDPRPISRNDATLP